ncbi:MAG: restriction endonuclease [Chloroflexi bacterium]|nr:restriction endonuclease [Chloroflexota bacterium]
MELTLDITVAKEYKSRAQQVRVLTEHWVRNQIYCPNCGYINMDKYPNNQPAVDFFCSSCGEDYELKSKQNSVGVKVVDGAYRTMIERLQSADNPNLFLLSYDLINYEVLSFFVVPKHFFVPGMIEKRKPLAPTARRAGWVGCNIALQSLPSSGKIFFVNNRKVEPKEAVLSLWRKTLFLRQEKDVDARGWTLDVMKCVEQLGKPHFTLDEVYEFESVLARKHPDNRHVRDKIRQQLQVLRDKGYLEFVSRGNYRLA